MEPASRAAPGAALAVKAPRQGPTGWRKWLYRLSAIVVGPAAFFGVLEAGLRLGGYGHDTGFFADGSAVEGPGQVIENRAFARRFFPAGAARNPSPPVPFALSAVKPGGTYRIFVLGESAAMGFPDPSVSFSRILAVLLQACYPETRFEVINTGLAAINSHAIVPIAHDCARYQPDLYVALIGNNEVVGPFGASGVLGTYAPRRRAIQARLWAQSTRTGQLLHDLIHSFDQAPDRPRAWQGMAMFVQHQVPATDERLPTIYEHFRANLEDVCRAGTNADASVVVCTVPVNLRHCAPFASVHAPDLTAAQTKEWEQAYRDGDHCEESGQTAAALHHYEQAAQIDDGFAELAFRRGRCLAALGRTAEARQRFARARDLDALRFRSDTHINDTIRQVAGDRAADNVYLVDAERAFDTSSPAGIAGEEFFLEHVHMNFHGNYLLARTVFDRVRAILPSTLNAAGEPLAKDEAAARLGYSDWHKLKIALQFQQLFKEPPYTNQLDHADQAKRWQERIDALRARVQKPAGVQAARSAFANAVAADGGDWLLRMNYGLFLSEQGAPAAAEVQYQAALDNLRHAFAAHYKLGRLKWQRGDLDGALTEYRAAIVLAPDYAEPHYGVAEVLAAQGHVDEALAICTRQLRGEANQAPVLVTMGTFLARAGRPAEAEARFREAVARDPENPLAHASLGSLLARLDQTDEAIREFETALRLQPEWPDVDAQLARLRR